jgi:hypothetical protein
MKRHPALGWSGARRVGTGADLDQDASQIGAGLEETAQQAFDKALAQQRATQRLVLWLGVGLAFAAGVGVIVLTRSHKRGRR